MLELKTNKKIYNYTDSRKLPVVKRVIAFVSQLSETDAQPIHNKKLCEIFGNASNDFAKHLKQLTLVKVNPQYIVGQTSQSYIRKSEGLEILKRAIGFGDREVAEVLTGSYSQFDDEIKSGVFVYNEKGNRFYHSLQMLRREIKDAFWQQHGYIYNIDIETCAATLIFQAAVHSGCPSSLLAEVKQYITDKNSIRNHYVELLGVDYATAKGIATAMINLARLGGKVCMISSILNREQIQKLRDDQYTKRLRASVKLMWKFLARKHKFKNDGVERWAFYRLLERRVMDIVVSQCQGRVFREHDGFRTDKAVDISAVEAVVKMKTGYDIVLSNK